jgi:hypothetical protein
MQASRFESNRNLYDQFIARIDRGASSNHTACLLDSWTCHLRSQSETGDGRPQSGSGGKASRSPTPSKDWKVRRYVPHVPAQQAPPSVFLLAARSKNWQKFQLALLLELALFLPLIVLLRLRSPHPSCLSTSASVMTIALSPMWGTHPPIERPSSPEATPAAASDQMRVRWTGQAAGSCLLAFFRLDGSGRNRDFALFCHVPYIVLLDYKDRPGILISPETAPPS